MDYSKLKISFLVSSIDLYDFVTNNIKPSNMIRLNLTQKPILIKEEYIVNKIQGLSNLNHEFVVENTQDSMKELTLTLRKVEKRRCLSNVLKNCNPKVNLQKDKSSSNIQYKYKYNYSDHSLLGYFTINIENLEKEVQHYMRVDIITKNDSIVIGHANIEIFKSDEIPKKKSSHGKKPKNAKNFYANILKNNNHSKNLIFDDPNYYLLD